MKKENTRQDKTIQDDVKESITEKTRQEMRKKKIEQNKGSIKERRIMNKIVNISSSLNTAARTRSSA